MKGRSRVVWYLATGALAMAILALVACDSRSPTEPEKAQNVTVTTKVPGAGPPGTYTIVTNVCDCTAADVGLFIDGVATSKLKCADTQIVPLPAGRHTLAFEWPDQRPAVSLTIEATDTSSGTIEVKCEYR